MSRGWLAAPALLTALIGCGGGAHDEVSVSGTVTLDGKALPGAALRFVPTGSTRGVGGMGRAGADGKYTLKGMRGAAGILPGTYKVVISKLVMPDGTDFPADSKVGPMDSPAKEQLPATYSDSNQTRLTATVPEGGGVVDFRLKRSGE
jgi:hypothetical protein